MAKGRSEAEKRSTALTLAVFFGYIVLLFVALAVMYVVRGDRPITAPETCASEFDCPVRSFCYRDVTTEELNFDEAFKNVTALEVDFNDDVFEAESLTYVCGCYKLYGEGGHSPIPGLPEELVPEEGFCNEEMDYKNMLLTISYIFVGITAFSSFHMIKTMFQLWTAEALQFNASGITMLLICNASICEFLLAIVYMIEIGSYADPPYKLNDSLRPTIFGFFAVAQMGALLEVSVMWADVYAKSTKVGGQDNSGKVEKMKKQVGATIIITFFIVVVPLMLGQTIIAGGWAALLVIGITISFWIGGRKLASLLMPSDKNAPGSSSAHAAATEIKKTATAIPIQNTIFLIGLGSHFAFVQRPHTGPASMFGVFLFLIVAVSHQFRLMYYVRFGNRKKLHKAGFKGFRSSLMSTVSSAVEPDESKGSVASTVASDP